MFKNFSITILLLSFIGIANAQVPLPPIEAYGELPIIRSVAISPNGKKLGYLKKEGDQELFLVTDLETNEVTGANTTGIKTRGVHFISNDYALLSASQTTKVQGYRDRFEYTTAFSFSVDSNRTTQLLKRTKSLYPAQSGLGKVVGSLNKKGQVLMPGFVGDRSTPAPPYHLFRVDPKGGTGRIFAKGNRHTIDWFVNKEGVVLAREDHDDGLEKYEILTKRNKKWETVYQSDDTPLVPINLMGVKSDESSLITISSTPDGKSDAIYELYWDGTFSEPLYVKENTEIDGVIADKNRKVFGIRYSGMRPSYKFFDENLNGKIQELYSKYPAFSIRIVSWSDDWSKIIVKIAGGQEADNYYLYQPNDQSLMSVGSSRSVPRESIGEITSIEYSARDGTKIPAILTWPVNQESKNRQNLPTIILPHGGPESYDQISFDWIAQYFASRGYLVLQPNFRGSTGFGWQFQKQGRGEWAGLMQDDVTDGVKSLISNGFSDPDKICIVGASYGGFSALAGGAFTPELYKCIAAYAPVTDLPMMLSEEKRKHGRSDSASYEYWSRIIGSPKEKNLKKISPSYHADKFKAPVLLIHGRDDTTVEHKQSNVMYKALKKAGADVQYLPLKGEDHWLSTSETRLEMLKAMDAFLAKHNPAF